MKKSNFLTAKYEWLVLALGIAVLAFGAYRYFTVTNEDLEDLKRDDIRRVESRKSDDLGVKPTDLSANTAALRTLRSPATVAEVSDKSESFLASERRVRCKCGKVISGDVKAVPECPYCHEKQEKESMLVIDADKDGLPDEWEKKFGLNPKDPSDVDADLDNDGFTNREEFLAKTNPADPKDHPPYLDSLKLTLPLKETKLPFYLVGASKIPAGWRCEFFDTTAESKLSKDKRGARITALINEEIGKTGFVLKSYEKKSAKREKQGMKGMFITYDASEVVVERKSDGRQITLVVQEGKHPVFAAVDVQATLQYERGIARNYDVVGGDELDLNGEKYRIVSVTAVGKGAEVVLENALSGKKHTLKALE